MEGFDKSEYSGVKKKHFLKLHEKIQRKYEEMQWKLEKSKSVDSLVTLQDNNEYIKQRHASNCDLRQIDELSDEIKNKIDPIKYTAIVENVPENNASFQQFEFNESSISELETEFMFIENNEIDNIQNKNKDLSNEFSKMSVESLNEAYLESDGSITPSSPSPKISIRNRISSRFSAVIEKRRKMEKEKNAMKEKKKESREKVEKFVLSNSLKQDVIKNVKRTKVATVTIALVEVTGLESDISEEKNRILFCRFRLGTEKYKSKLIKSSAFVVKWQELFNLNMYEESVFELSLWDKDALIGRNVVDLLELEKEKTHKMHVILEGELGNVIMFILLTISGTSLMNNLVDIHDYEETQIRLSDNKNNFTSGDVGGLSIILYGAKGLSGNDCYCILELANERLQTHTESKTADPNWMKIFTFNVTDITSLLEVTVHDEKKSEDVGKVSIPLLNIKNGEKKWYALKDSTQRDRAKGNNPRILLEMRIYWNLLRASVRVINPKEVKYLETDEKFDRHMFSRNLSRSKAVLAWVFNAFQVIKTCFEWESRKWNIIALTIWLLFCWFFKMWMLPLLLLIPFVWYRRPKYYLIYWKKYLQKDTSEQDNEEDLKKEEKSSSLRQKIHSLQEMVQTVQNGIGTFASLGESIKNLFNFTVPFLSCLAIFMITVIGFIMYIIPVKYIFMFWGVHKFTRKILRPNRIPNNEILDLLSRVPDDEMLQNCDELPLEEIPEEDVIK